MPVWLSIPALHIQAPVEQKALTPAGDVDVPSGPNSVAWYDHGPIPGQPGNAVISGHLDTPSGGAIFSSLDHARPGDSIAVTLADGRAIQFRVTTLTYYPYNAELAMLFATAGPSHLSLITCAGSWDGGRHTYRQRLIVYAIATG
ncbi:MAG: class F sortase [Candidatus Dormibacteraeota bacterium]|nr:class F sortase [Candidatus Dormibacteraeota bacterium]